MLRLQVGESIINDGVQMQAEELNPNGTWIIRCPVCNHDQTCESLGWKRRAAISIGKRQVRRCPECARPRWMHVVKVDENGEVIRPTGKQVAVLISAFVFGFAALGLGIVFIVQTALKSSVPYERSVAITVKHKAVIQQIGNPIETQIFRGSIHNGVANFDIPVSGPRGTGSVHVEGHRNNGDWKLTVVNFSSKQIDNPINLLQDE